MDPDKLDPLDLRLLHALQLDGRASFTRIAEVLNVSDRTLARRFARLRAVAPARLTSVARALAADAESAFVAAVTGEHNLLAIAVCRDQDALYAYLSDRIASLPGVGRLETTPITSYVKRVAPVP